MRAPTEEQLQAGYDELVRLSMMYSLPPSVIEGHCQVPGVKKACPGKYIMAISEDIRREVSERLPLVYR